MAPIMLKLKEIKPDVTIEEIDIDDCHLLAAKYKVKMLPTIIILDEEIEIARFQGVVSLETILEKL
jgi:thioredoxin-like negative regulator of GroEL